MSLCQITESFRRVAQPVSYTHLDVYKRQVYGSPIVVRWDVSLAWLVVGIVRVPPSNARAYMETI